MATAGSSPPPTRASTTPAKFVARFQTTKHSWKGKYKRIISIAEDRVVTVNPGTWEITNAWPYNEEFVEVTPSPKNAQEFTIVLRKKNSTKTETLTFSAVHRAELLTFVQRYRPFFVLDARLLGSTDPYPVRKLGWNGTTKPTSLVPSFSSIDQVNKDGQVLCSYMYKDIERIDTLESPGGFIIYYGGFGRMHLFSMENRDVFLSKARNNSLTYVGVNIILGHSQLGRDGFELGRLGKYSADEDITSLAEFKVLKMTTRNDGSPVVRTLCLTETCITERDPASYAIVTIRSLADVFALIRYPDDAQKFGIEYKSGIIRKYTSTERDPLLASLVDGVRASGNRDVCIKRTETGIFDRVGPWNVPVEEEIQIMYLKSVGSYDPSIGITFDQMVSRFNVNVDYSGLNLKTLLDSKEAELIHNAINVVLTVGQPTFETSPAAATEQFECLRRLFASKVGFEAFTSLEGCRAKLGKRIVQALKMNDDGVIFAAVDTLCTLMQPMHDYYDLTQEQMNKKSLLSSKAFMNGLIQLLGQHAQQGTGAIIIASLLDFVTFALCEPYNETTDAEQFEMLLTMVADLGRKFFKLFQHPSLAIVKGAGLIMRTIIEEGPEEVMQRMQAMSLSEGAILKHLNTAIFTQSTDNRMLTHRELSRQLIDLWTSDNANAAVLLKQIFPVGLLVYLESTETAPEDDTIDMDLRDKKAGSRPKKQSQLEILASHWRNRSFLRFDNKPKPQPRQVVMRLKNKRIRTKSNWLMLYYQTRRDHSRPDLIWNHKTREELRDALESELRAFNIDKDLGGNIDIAWNYVEFEVKYESLAEELKIGEHYVRLLLEQGVTAASVRNAHVFFYDLYHRFLLANNTSMRTMCLQAMAIVYGAYYNTIGQFNDLRYVVRMLNTASTRIERDRLLTFLDKLLYLPENSKDFIFANGVRILVDLLTLAHLHVDRAVTPLATNLIEAGDMKRESEKEWYFSNSAGERQGPYGLDEMEQFYQQKKITTDTKCWAQGMDGWRKLTDVTQLKWGIIATEHGVLNESEIAVICLNMLNRLCEYYPSRAPDGAVIRPLPKLKRFLSESTCLPHLVNLFLTFDPALVERVAVLLTNILEDNPVLPKLFLTGAFYFMLMYPGSNVLPIAQLLQKAHSRQAFRSEEDIAPAHNLIAHRSIIGAMLPTAMVCFLENYGASKFAETFLGNFDTPEAIWNHEMRRFLIEKISVHIQEFTPRLLSNTHALFQYIPMPKILYPELEEELFCSIYYLRHLCDIARFPDWPIKHPIELLKDVLDEWKREVEKKPSTMSFDEAMKILGLDKETVKNEGSVRKNYYKLANKYHPDKNPDGREMFESVNKAYEFLISTSKTKNDGPDPKRIILLLRSQSILFSRYGEVLKPYKYAGYPMLIRTIEMETMDDRLFSRPHPLLPAASELAFHTVRVSALNAEELRRENGLEVVSQAFNRCVDVIQAKCTPEETAVQVSTHLLRLFAAAVAFDKCREKLHEQPQVVSNVARCMFFKGAPKLTAAALECIIAMAIDKKLQDMLLDAGVHWHLLQSLFLYDYTLVESGVQASVESNQQEVANYNAHVSFRALGRLGGYFRRDENSPPEVPPSFIRRVTGADGSSVAVVGSTSTPSVPPGTVENGAGADAPAVLSPEQEWKANRMLNGVEMETPVNERLRKGLRALLTPYLEKQLAVRDGAEALKLATSNSETPYLIWNNGLRAELNELIERAQERAFKGTLRDQTLGAGFTFTELQDELMVGDIYVRVYNLHPQFILEDYDGFTLALLAYLRRTGEILLKNLTSEDDPSIEPKPKTLERTDMVLNGLANVLRIQPELARHTINRYKLLFYFLRVSESPAVQQNALEVISLITSNKDCVASIAESGVMVNILIVIEQVPAVHELALEALYALSSNTKLVAELLQKGALLYLLNMFCNSRNPTVRNGTVGVFAKMAADKLHGPRIVIQLSKFLPPIFMDAMRENAEASIHMFESNQENPELVWDEAARRRVQAEVARMQKELYQEQLENPNAKFTLPEGFEPVYGTVEGHLIIGGVFVSLFIKQPNWGLRNPRDFAVGLMDSFVAGAASKNIKEDVLNQISEAMVMLLNLQSLMAPYLASLGYVNRLFSAISQSDHDVVMMAGVGILRAISEHQACIEAMAATNCITPIIHLMKTAPKAIGMAAEALHNIFEKNNPEKGANIVKQAIDAQLIQFVLSLLEHDVPGVENTSAVKAQLVNALKAMVKDMQYGEDVRNILDESNVWNAYRDQRHDLFLTHETVKGYLTGPVSATKGYLTAGPANVTLPTAPPPMDDDFS